MYYYCPILCLQYSGYLKLVGKATMESDDESGDDSEQNKTTVCWSVYN